MVEEPAPANYLDALFGSLRAFTRELEASRTWLSRAEQTGVQAWRLSFLRAARDAFERAHGCLGQVRERLAVFGPAEAVPSPLDRIQQNLTAMRSNLEAQARRIGALEENIGLTPVGSG